MQIKIKYHVEGIDKVAAIKTGDWIDLRAAETITLKQGELKYISLGVSMKLPEGYEAQVAPRSSTFKNWGIIQANSIGIIDNSYSGTNDIWRFPAYAVRDTVVEKTSASASSGLLKRCRRLILLRLISSTKPTEAASAAPGRYRL
jgi:dUTPase